MGFVETLKAKVDKIKTEVTDGVNPPEVQLLADSNAATAYNTANCEGQSIALSSIHYNILCGTHWKNSGGIGSCNGRGNLKFTYDSTPKNTCTNDQVRSIMLPPMTTAKLYKHCKAPTASKQVRYPTLENFGTTAKCVDVPLSAFDLSNVVLEGNVLQVDAKVVGTEADYFESQFTAGSSAVQGASSAGGVGAAGTALIAIGCVGVAVAVVAGLATRKKSMGAPKAQISNSNAVTQQASNEDQTDVL